MAINGSSTEQFSEVRREFERNFSERHEVGASVCVTLDGETVVDLWGGTADPARGRAWERDTIGLIWSSTKGATSLVAWMLVARGELDLDAPVAEYWPEFAKNGKENLPVRFLLTHQAGLAALRDPIPSDGYFDWDLITDLLAAQEPLWEPGTRHGYHALTYGHLVGEVCRRITGETIGEFFRREIAEPRALEFWIGLPAECEDRIAPTIPAALPGPDDPIPSFYRAGMSDPASVPGLVLFNSGDLLAPGFMNTKRGHASGLPAMGGIANARGLAGMYRALAIGGDGLVGPDEVAGMSSTMAAGLDATMLVPTRWSTGFVKSIDNSHLGPGDRDGCVMSENAFGYVGMGGSMGFADPSAYLSFGYTMNRQGMTTGLDARAQSLIDATYRALGYVRGDRGSWRP